MKALAPSLPKRYQPMFRCKLCNVCTHIIGEYYMLHNELWIQVCKIARIRKTGMLCIGCVETTLNRKLTKSDFTGVAVNDGTLYLQSSRLRARLKRQPNNPAMQYWS